MKSYLVFHDDFGTSKSYFIPVSFEEAEKIATQRNINLENQGLEEYGFWTAQRASEKER